MTLLRYQRKRKLRVSKYVRLFLTLRQKVMKYAENLQYIVYVDKIAINCEIKQFHHHV